MLKWPRPSKNSKLAYQRRDTIPCGSDNTKDCKKANIKAAKIISIFNDINPGARSIETHEPK